MFEFLHDVYLEDALTLSQLEKKVEKHNAHVAQTNKIKAVDLSSGGFVSLKKYLTKSQKLQKQQEELRSKERKCMEMRMRILLLEQRLKAYEYMFTDMSETRDETYI